MSRTTEKRELRRFSIILAVAGAAAGSVWFWRGHVTAAQIFAALSLYGLLSALVHPPLARPAHRILTTVGHRVGWFNTRLVLVLLFYLVFTPIGVLLRLLGKDLLDRKRGGRRDSYWIEKKQKPFDPKRYEKQF